MGLDTSHDCWHGAYSAFTRWREALCLAAGWQMTTLHDDGSNYKIPICIDWDSLEEKNYYGEWDKWPDDPLVILIAHSDCEGKIPHAHCRHLADRLEQLLPNLETLGSGGGHVGHYAEKTRQFISGLRLADERGEDVDFH